MTEYQFKNAAKAQSLGKKFDKVYCRLEKLFARYEKRIQKVYINTTPLTEVLKKDARLASQICESNTMVLKRVRGGWHGKITLGWDDDAFEDLKNLEERMLLALIELDALQGHAHKLGWQLLVAHGDKFAGLWRRLRANTECGDRLPIQPLC